MMRKWWKVASSSLRRLLLEAADEVYKVRGAVSSLS